MLNNIMKKKWLTLKNIELYGIVSYMIMIGTNFLKQKIRDILNFEKKQTTIENSISDSTWIYL